MSQPRKLSQSAAPSSSKPSLRLKPSDVPPPIHPIPAATTERSLLPSPHFEDTPNVYLDQQEHQQPHGGSESYSREHSPLTEEQEYHQSEHSQLTYPNFQPFFTLIEDKVTNTHHHPTVHYIFADDDTDIITEAAVRSLDENDPSYSSQAITSQTESEQRQQQHQPEDERVSHHEGVPSGMVSRLPPSKPGVKEHYIVLDMQPASHSRTLPILNHPTTSDPAGGGLAYSPNAQLPSPSPNTPSGLGIVGGTGHNNPTTFPEFEVVNTQSFSADWQVLRTNITTAPTIGGAIGDEADDTGDVNEGLLMLRIEGRGSVPLSTNVAEDEGQGVGGREKDRQQQQSQKESVDEMIQRFQKRLDEIRLVMETGAKNQVLLQDVEGRDEPD